MAGFTSIKTIGYHRDRGDGAARGLYLQVRAGESGLTRSWSYRVRSPITRKERWMGLGPCDVISLAEARELARAARRLVVLGADPIDHRQATVEAERDALIRDKASRMTFRQCADAYLSAHLAKHRSDSHRHQWRDSLALASASFGDLAVGLIDTPMVVKFLEPICRDTLNTGLRHRGRVEAVLDWASVHKFRDRENPARWKGHLEHVFQAKPKPKHHEAMPFADVPAFLAKVRSSESIGAAALEFTVLTAARRSESLNAQWDEIDLEKKLWTIPGDRMKKGKEHFVPLSDRALAILDAMSRDGAFIFTNGGKRLGVTAMQKLIAKVDKNGFTLHGFRSSFRDWAGECTSFDREVIEHALAHQLPDAVEAAYRRGTAIEKRKLLVQAWANYCAGIEAASNVTQLRA